MKSRAILPHFLRSGTLLKSWHGRLIGVGSWGKGEPKKEVSLLINLGTKRLWLFCSFTQHQIVARGSCF